MSTFLVVEVPIFELDAFTGDKAVIANLSLTLSTYSLETFNSGKSDLGSLGCFNRNLLLCCFITSNSFLISWAQLLKTIASIFSGD